MLARFLRGQLQLVLLPQESRQNTLCLYVISQ
ncbi:hypothetical protein SEB_00630 [Staphylococcus epidermidis PM221]|nr:hypothetical protein SEB_00630 [Staphylococcus epidermidis PM221]